MVSGGGQVIITGPTQAPPPPRAEASGPSRRGYIWMAGSWTWDQQARQYTWVPGHWERSKANHRWEAPRWEQQNGAWIRIEGSWRIN